MSRKHDGPEPCLRCRDLRPAGPAWAHRPGLDVDLLAGDLLAAIGPDGCGKSSLLRTIAGLDGPRTGEVSIRGNPVFSLPPGGLRPDIIGSHHRPREDLTVRQNVLAGCAAVGNAGSTPQAADLALESTGLAERATEPAASLSAAEKHLLVLARELAAGPHLVLLDDPYRDLDAAARTRIAAAIGDARGRLRSAVVYTSQAPDEITVTATRQVDLFQPATGARAGAGARPSQPLSPTPPGGLPGPPHRAVTALPPATGPVQARGAMRWLAVESYLSPGGKMPHAACSWPGPLTRCRDAVLIFQVQQGPPARDAAQDESVYFNVPPCVHFDLAFEETAGGDSTAPAAAVARPLRGQGRRRRGIRLRVTAQEDLCRQPARAGRVAAAARGRSPGGRPTLLVCRPGSGPATVRTLSLAGLGGETVLPVVDIRGLPASRVEPGVEVPYAYLLAEDTTADAVARALRRGRIIAALPTGHDLRGSRRPDLAAPPPMYGPPDEVLAVHAARRAALAALKRAAAAGTGVEVGPRKRLLAAYWALMNGNFGMVENILGHQ